LSEKLKDYFSSAKISFGNKHNFYKFDCHLCYEYIHISNMSRIIFIEIDEFQGIHDTFAFLALLNSGRRVGLMNKGVFDERVFKIEKGVSFKTQIANWIDQPGSGSNQIQSKLVLTFGSRFTEKY